VSSCGVSAFAVGVGATIQHGTLSGTSPSVGVPAAGGGAGSGGESAGTPSDGSGDGGSTSTVPVTLPPNPTTPTAAFTVSADPTIGQPVTFDGSGSTCLVIPCTYTWDDDGGEPPVGDWPLGTGQVLQYTFTGSAFTAYVRLTVTDALGQTGTVEHDVFVANPSSPPPSPPVVGSPGPSISGTAQEGDKLTANHGTWSNSPTSYGYQWQDCSSSCSDISGATGSTYVLGSSDVGDTIDVVVTATNAAGSGTATSAKTATVTAPSPPVVGSPGPSISGTAQQGDTLTANHGSWSNSPTGYGYQWQDCSSSCSNISGATGSSYVLGASDVGDTIDVVVTATNAGGSGTATSGKTATVTASSGGGGGGGSGVFPLKVSGDGRYLVTQGGTPFLLVGDSPQSLIGNLSTSSASSYFADREAHGFDAAWVNLLCDSYTFCASNGDTYDGVAPFTSGSNPSSYDLADPNSAYFSRAHADIAAAETDGIEVFLDPIETGGCADGGWMTTLENNGDGSVDTSTNDYKYGEYLGSEFKDLPNVVWMFGNDFQCYTYGGNDADVYSVAEGILAADPGALMTLELNFCDNGGNTCIGTSSLDDTEDNWAGILGLNGAYTYSPIYAEILHAYNQAAVPDFLEEANYEGEDNNATDGGSTQNLRLQEYWTMTSGAAGQFYGCHCTDGISMGWTSSGIDTIGAQQLQYQTNLLESLGEWYNLVPDQNHTLVTAGYGSCPTTGSIDGVNCVTDTETPDHTLALAYLPQGGTITVAMSQLAGTTTARWFDPTNGQFTTISGSPFPATGTHKFTTPGNNTAGDPDWLLVLTTT
jgi:Protein of unknown function (DUF4038)/Putative collagen-binding domain of a collagenase